MPDAPEQLSLRPQATEACVKEFIGEAAKKRGIVCGCRECRAERSGKQDPPAKPPIDHKSAAAGEKPEE